MRSSALSSSLFLVSLFSSLVCLVSAGDLTGATAATTSQYRATTDATVVFTFTTCADPADCSTNIGVSGKVNLDLPSGFILNDSADDCADMSLAANTGKTCCQSSVLNGASSDTPTTAISSSSISVTRPGTGAEIQPSNEISISCTNIGLPQAATTGSSSVTISTFQDSSSLLDSLDVDMTFNGQSTVQAAPLQSASVSFRVKDPIGTTYPLSAGNEGTLTVIVQPASQTAGSIIPSDGKIVVTLGSDAGSWSGTSSLGSSSCKLDSEGLGVELSSNVLTLTRSALADLDNSAEYTIVCTDIVAPPNPAGDGTGTHTIDIRDNTSGVVDSSSDIAGLTLTAAQIDNPAVSVLLSDGNNAGRKSTIVLEFHTQQNSEVVPVDGQIELTFPSGGTWSFGLEADAIECRICSNSDCSAGEDLIESVSGSVLTMTRDDSDTMLANTDYALHCSSVKIPEDTITDMGTFSLELLTGSGSSQRTLASTSGIAGFDVSYPVPWTCASGATTCGDTTLFLTSISPKYVARGVQTQFTLVGNDDYPFPSWLVDSDIDCATTEVTAVEQNGHPVNQQSSRNPEGSTGQVVQMFVPNVDPGTKLAVCVATGNWTSVVKVATDSDDLLSIVSNAEVWPNNAGSSSDIITSSLRLTFVAGTTIPAHGEMHVDMPDAVGSWGSPSVSSDSTGLFSSSEHEVDADTNSLIIKGMDTSTVAEGSTVVLLVSGIELDSTAGDKDGEEFSITYYEHACEGGPTEISGSAATTIPAADVLAAITAGITLDSNIVFSGVSNAYVAGTSGVTITLEEVEGSVDHTSVYPPESTIIVQGPTGFDFSGSILSAASAPATFMDSATMTTSGNQVHITGSATGAAIDDQSRIRVVLTGVTIGDQVLSRAETTFQLFVMDVNNGFVLDRSVARTIHDYSDTVEGITGPSATITVGNVSPWGLFMDATAGGTVGSTATHLWAMIASSASASAADVLAGTGAEPGCTAMAVPLEDGAATEQIHVPDADSSCSLSQGNAYYLHVAVGTSASDTKLAYVGTFGATLPDVLHTPDKATGDEEVITYVRWRTACAIASNGNFVLNFGNTVASDKWVLGPVSMLPLASGANFFDDWKISGDDTKVTVTGKGSSGIDIYDVVEFRLIGHRTADSTPSVATAFTISSNAGETDTALSSTALQDLPIVLLNNDQTTHPVVQLSQLGAGAPSTLTVTNFLIDEIPVRANGEFIVDFSGDFDVTNAAFAACAGCNFFGSAGVTVTVGSYNDDSWGSGPRVILSGGGASTDMLAAETFAGFSITGLFNPRESGAWTVRVTSATLGGFHELHRATQTPATGNHITSQPSIATYGTHGIQNVNLGDTRITIHGADLESSQSAAGNPTVQFQSEGEQITGAYQSGSSSSLSAVFSVALNADNVGPLSASVCIEGSCSEGFHQVATIVPEITGFTYYDVDASYEVGSAIQANAPYVTLPARPTSYTSGGLPAGLSIDSDTGVISGTPTVVQSRASYTVTASDGLGPSMSVTVSIEVTGMSVLTHGAALGRIGTGGVPDPIVLVKGTAASAITFSLLTPAAYTTYTFGVSPALPLGLVMDASTGTITGTPTQASLMLEFTVTATDYAAYSVSTTFWMRVNDAEVAAPTGFSYDSYTGEIGTALSVDPSTTDTGASLYTIWGGIPQGLTLNTATGSITGIPENVQSTDEYTVLAENNGGSTRATISFTLTGLQSISYPEDDIDVSVNSGFTMSLTTVYNDVILTDFVITPTNSFGMQMDAATGHISFDMDEITLSGSGSDSSSETFTVSQTVSGKTVSTQFTIHVRGIDDFSYNDGAGTTLASVTPATYSVGAAMSNSPKDDFRGVVDTKPVAPDTCVLHWAGDDLRLEDSTDRMGFHIQTGDSLPSGLMLDHATGVISGTPTTPGQSGTYTIRATNEYGYADAYVGLTIDGPANFYYSSVDNDFVSISTSSFMSCTGVEASCSGDFTTTSTLPAGVTVNSNAVTTNSASPQSPTELTIKTTSDDASVSHKIWLHLFDDTEQGPDAIWYDRQAVALKVGMTMSTNNAWYSGSQPDGFKVLPDLPAGLIISSNGAISGTPTSVTGKTSHTVWAYNGGGSSSVVVDIEVFGLNELVFEQGTELVFHTNSRIKSNRPFLGKLCQCSASPTCTNGIDRSTAVFTVVPEELPEGIMMSASGVLYGTPTTSQTAKEYVVTATDSHGATATTTLTVTVQDSGAGFDGTPALTMASPYADGFSVNVNGDTKGNTVFCVAADSMSGAWAHTGNKAAFWNTLKAAGQVSTASSSLTGEDQNLVFNGLTAGTMYWVVCATSAQSVANTQANGAISSALTASLPASKVAGEASGFVGGSVKLQDPTDMGFSVVATLAEPEQQWRCLAKRTDTKPTNPPITAMEIWKGSGSSVVDGVGTGNNVPNRLTWSLSNNGTYYVACATSTSSASATKTNNAYSSAAHIPDSSETSSTDTGKITTTKAPVIKKWTSSSVMNVAVGASNWPISIYGINFLAGTVALEDSAANSVTCNEVIGTFQIRCTLTIASDAPTGDLSATITTPEGVSEKTVVAQIVSAPTITENTDDQSGAQAAGERWITVNGANFLDGSHDRPFSTHSSWTLSGSGSLPSVQSVSYSSSTQTVLYLSEALNDGNAGALSASVTALGVSTDSTAILRVYPSAPEITLDYTSFQYVVHSADAITRRLVIKGTNFGTDATVTFAAPFGSSVGALPSCASEQLTVTNTAITCAQLSIPTGIANGYLMATVTRASDCATGDNGCTSSSQMVASFIGGPALSAQSTRKIVVGQRMLQLEGSFPAGCLDATSADIKASVSFTASESTAPVATLSAGESSTTSLWATFTTAPLAANKGGTISATVCCFGGCSTEQVQGNVIDAAVGVYSPADSIVIDGNRPLMINQTTDFHLSVRDNTGAELADTDEWPTLNCTFTADATDAPCEVYGVIPALKIRFTPTHDNQHNYVGTLKVYNGTADDSLSELFHGSSYNPLVYETLKADHMSVQCMRNDMMLMNTDDGVYLGVGEDIDCMIACLGGPMKCSTHDIHVSGGDNTLLTQKSDGSAAENNMTVHYTITGGQREQRLSFLFAATSELLDNGEVYIKRQSAVQSSVEIIGSTPSPHQVANDACSTVDAECQPVAGAATPTSGPTADATAAATPAANTTSRRLLQTAANVYDFIILPSSNALVDYVPLDKATALEALVADTTSRFYNVDLVTRHANPSFFVTAELDNNAEVSAMTATFTTATGEGDVFASTSFSAGRVFYRLNMDTAAPVTVTATPSSDTSTMTVHVVSHGLINSPTMDVGEPEGLTADTAWTSPTPGVGLTDIVVSVFAQDLAGFQSYTITVFVDAEPHCRDSSLTNVPVGATDNCNSLNDQDTCQETCDPALYNGGSATWTCTAGRLMGTHVTCTEKDLSGEHGLTGVTFAGVAAFTFDAAVTTYPADAAAYAVENAVSSASFDVAMFNTSFLYISGAAQAQGVATGSVSLNVGANAVTAQVLSEAAHLKGSDFGTSSAVYTININRKAATTPDPTAAAPRTAASNLVVFLVATVAALLYL